MSAFTDGFEKQAGAVLRNYNKLKGKFTGMDYLYHGTSPANASKIRKSGLKTDLGSTGVSSEYPIGDGKTVADINKGLGFTSKDKDVAKIYATNQTVRELVRGEGTGYMPKVVRFAVPKKVVAKNKRVNPEIAAQPGMKREAMNNLDPSITGREREEYSKLFDRGMARQRKVEKHDVPLKGGVDKKYISNPGLDERIVSLADNRLVQGAAAVAGGSALYNKYGKKKKKEGGGT